MATTDYPVNHPLAVKLWSRKLAIEALKATSWAQFAGESENSLIQVFDDTAKGPGDRITVGLRVQLTGRGRTEGQGLEGNEEALVTYSDNLFINELRHAVRVKMGIDKQRVTFKAREQARMGLEDWYRDRLDTWFFNTLCGLTSQTDTIYTGFNATTAPTSASSGNTNAQRIIYANGDHSSEASLSTTNTFKLSYIDNAVNLAKITSPVIRPVRVGGNDMYVMFLHPNQVRAMRTDTNTGQWADIQKSALMGGEIEDNPIFTGALGVYNNVILFENTRVPLAPATTNVRRAVLCGAQSVAMAWGQDTMDEPKWIEKRFDYDNEHGTSLMVIGGMKKLVYNGADFGSIVVSTYSTAPVGTGG